MTVKTRQCVQTKIHLNNNLIPLKLNNWSGSIWDCMCVQIWTVVYLLGTPTFDLCLRSDGGTPSKIHHEPHLPPTPTSSLHLISSPPTPNNYTTAAVCPISINSYFWNSLLPSIRFQNHQSAWRWFCLSAGPSQPVRAMPGQQSHYPNARRQTEGEIQQSILFTDVCQTT